MENKYNKIIYLNKEEEILQFISETDYIYNERLAFIRKLEKKKILWNEALKLSLVWHNIKFKNCKYNKDLWNQIKDFF